MDLGDVVAGLGLEVADLESPGKDPLRAEAGRARAAILNKCG